VTRNQFLSWLVQERKSPYPVSAVVAVDSLLEAERERFRREREKTPRKPIDELKLKTPPMQSSLIVPVLAHSYDPKFKSINTQFELAVMTFNMSTGRTAYCSFAGQLKFDNFHDANKIAHSMTREYCHGKPCL